MQDIFKIKFQIQKENKMKGILIWAVICLAICGIGAYFVQKDIMTTGTDIELSVSDSRTLEIKASEKVTFEGASSSFFML